MPSRLLLFIAPAYPASVYKALTLRERGGSAWGNQPRAASQHGACSAEGMPRQNFLRALAIVTGCLVHACSSSTNSASDPRSSSDGGVAGVLTTAGASSGNHSAGASGGQIRGAGGDGSHLDGAGSAADSNAADSSGAAASTADSSMVEGGSAGDGTSAVLPLPAGGTASTNPADAECDLNGGCVSKCTDQTVTCSVQRLDSACELQGFVGASTQVACGQRAVIGTACCGG